MWYENFRFSTYCVEQGLPGVFAILAIQHFLVDTHPRGHKQGNSQQEDPCNNIRNMSIDRLISVLK